MSEAETAFSPLEFTTICDADAIESKTNPYKTSVSSFSAGGDLVETTLTISHSEVFVSWQVDPGASQSRFDGAVLKVNGAVKYTLGDGVHTVEPGTYLHRATGLISASNPSVRLYSVLRHK